MTNALPVRRGRPRNFDRNQVLLKAMQTFWENGYEGTSMTQLVDAMGIGSPSIYAAFGSKEELFREAVELYVASEANAAWWALDQIENTQQAVQATFFASIDAFFHAKRRVAALWSLALAIWAVLTNPCVPSCANTGSNFASASSFD